MNKFFYIIIACFGIFLSFSAIAETILPTVTVMADSSMSVAVAKIARDYSRKNKTVVSSSFASQKIQQAQISEGAEADILITTKSAWIDELKLQGLVDFSSQTLLARNSLVLIGAVDSELALEKSGQKSNKFPTVAIINSGVSSGISYDANSDTESSGIEPMFVVANPESLAEGSYSKESLRKLGASGDLEPYTLYVNQEEQIFDIVAKKKAFALCFASSVYRRNDVKIIDTMPEESYQPIKYYAVVIAGDNMNEARKFLQYLKTKEAKEILANSGFKVD